MKQIVKSEQSLNSRISSSIDYNDLLNSESFKFAYDVINDESQAYWVSLQVKKFIEDFTVNHFKDDFDYYFNADVLRVIEVFLRLLNLATAKDVTLIGDPIINHAKPFQFFMLMNVFACEKKKNFRKIVIKSLYCLFHEKTAKFG
ncbi:hypothetical protein [Exiguobacterium artemiae]|uniref:hypothetical protein n=1 Tax=Exiguobacterium artemiae TaxID=340145 RepID=UPI00047D250D|nr:hypothetical protein [Exiguobacterium sibiricum]